LSSGNQGIVFPSVSTGNTTVPGKAVGEGTRVSVAVGAGVNVGGTWEAETGDGLATGAQPLPKATSRTSGRTSGFVNFFMTLPPVDLTTKEWINPLLKLPLTTPGSLRDYRAFSNRL
jgi:hypothetical protein